MPKMTIPTIFTAVDKLSPAVLRMGASMDRMERHVRKAGKSFNFLEKEALSFVGQAALIGSAFAVFRTGVDAIADYETALHSLESVTGVAAEKFRPQIESIAINTRKSAIDVTKSFERIGSAMSQYLESPEALGKIAEAGIILAKASRQELEPTLDNLTSVMNQFKIGADGAFDAVNRLTAGEIVGSVSTNKIAMALQEFGANAETSNVSLGESIALLEVLGKQMDHSKIAVGARNLLLVLSSAKGLDKMALKSLQQNNVNLDTLMDKSKPLGVRLKELSKIEQDAIAMVRVFGKENITAGNVIFSNLKTYEEWEKKIQETNKAQEQAAINSDTLANAAMEVKNSFINAVVAGDKLIPSLELIKSLTFWVARNMDSILGIATKVAGAFLVWRGSLLLLRAGIFAANAAANAFFLVDTIKYIATSRGITFATAAWGVAQQSLNAAFLANPIGVVAVGVGLLALATWGVVRALSAESAEIEALNSIQKRAMENTIDQRVETNLLFSALRKTTVGTQEYSELLRKIDAMQPGIVEKYNLTAGAIQNINRAEKELTESIIKRGEAEAKAELLREKTRQFIENQMNGPSLMQNIRGLGGAFGGTGVFLADQERLQNEIKAIADFKIEAINPEQTKMEQSGTMSGNINVNVNDSQKRTDWKSNAPGINIKTTSTVGSF